MGCIPSKVQRIRRRPSRAEASKRVGYGPVAGFDGDGIHPILRVPGLGMQDGFGSVGWDASHHKGAADSTASIPRRGFDTGGVWPCCGLRTRWDSSPPTRAGFGHAGWVWVCRMGCIPSRGAADSTAFIPRRGFEAGGVWSCCGLRTRWDSSHPTCAQFGLVGWDASHQRVPRIRRRSSRAEASKRTGEWPYCGLRS
jgi:hypothetical protein